jgi:phage tail protein X
MADRWVQQNLSVEQQVTEIYVATFGRAPDAAGLAYWVNEVETGSLTINQVAQSFFDQPETQAKYPDGTTTTSFVLAVYTNALHRSPDQAGLNYWVAELESGSIPRELFIISILRGAYDDVSVSPATLDNSLLTNLRIASEYYSASPAAAPDQFVLGEAFAVLDPVTADASTIVLSQALTRQFSEDGGEQAIFTLTDGIDTLVGNDADNTFFAPIVQNNSGGVINTFETGDVLNGAAGNNRLEVDLTETGSNSVTGGPAISATTNDIQEVYLRAQYPQDDYRVNDSTIDAERMFGVEQWWTENSRADIQLEDVRSLPEVTAFGMRQTDPGVSYTVYFDPAQVSDDRIVSIESSLTLILEDSSSPDAELENFPIDGVVFDLNGERYTVNFDLGEGAERTYANLVVVLNEALDADPELADLQAVLNADNSITITDSNSGTFEAVGYTWIDNVVPPSGALNWDLVVGAPVQEDVPVETNVVLDDVGRTSQGGFLDIGSMGDGGVAVFNVTVDRSSWLSQMESTSNLGGRNGPALRNLETVNLASTGANGDLAVGDLAQVPVNQGFYLDGRVEDGLTDVRIVNGSDFAGSLNLGITLTEDSVDRYLDEATGEVEFNYTASAQDDNLTIAVDDFLADDPDFAMNVLMGEGDDRLNIAVETASSVVVDGGAGANVIAVVDSHGTGAGTFEEFSGFQTYEVEGDNDDVFDIDDVLFDGTAHDFTNMPGVEDVVIATFTNSPGTALIDLEDGTTVTVSGKNQTLDNNSNDGQVFRDIWILGADGATQDVTLQNTARVNAGLFVAELFIGDESDDNESAVRTLNLESAGGRDTTNRVDDLNAPLVNTFNLTGTQDLIINELTAAANSEDTAADREDLEVDASELTGDLFLGINGVVITDLNDEDADTTVTLTGTEGDSDNLAIVDNVETTTATTIADFETITFGHRAASGGVFDATNVSDVELYNLASLNDPLEINNMDGEETVAINVEPIGFGGNGFADQDITLIAGSPATTNTLTVEFYANSIDTDGVDFDSTLSTQDFRTVTLDLGGTSAEDWDYALDLVFLDEDGLAPGEVDFDADTVYARTLNVIGGVDQDRGDGDVDTVDLGDLQTALTSVDVSAYNGEVTGAWDSLEGRNATIRVNEYDFVWDIGGTVAGGTAEVQTLNFAGFGDLAIGASVDITFAGATYTFTNATLAVIAEADIAAAIVADAANAPAAFAIADGGPGLVELTAVALADQADAVVAASNAGNDAAAVDVATTAEGAAAVNEVQTLDFAGIGNLAAGESISITFAGVAVTLTAPAGGILEADIPAAFSALAGPAEFAIALNGGLVELTATAPGPLADAVVQTSDVIANNPLLVDVATTTEGVAAVNEVQTLDFTGFGNLLEGETIEIEFAGVPVTVIAPAGGIAEAGIAAAIVAQAALDGVVAFAAVDVAGDLQLTAAAPGPRDDTMVTASDEGNVAAAVVVDDVTPGQAPGLTDASEFITTFRFTEDGYAEGVVWQVDGFQPFNDPADLVTLDNLSILDLRDLGVEGLAEITIQTGDVFWASLTADEQAEYDADEALLINDAANTVITSNEGLDFTILLTGVTTGSLSNENFAFA